MTEAGRVALVHDYLLVLRGAERVFGVIADCWPAAPVYTALYSREGTARRFDGREVHTSYLQRLRIGQRGFRPLLPLYPRAIERLDLAGRSLVISSSSAFAHGVRPDDGAVHVCFCHSPFRYAWHERASALAEVPRIVRPAVDRSLARIRDWDRATAQRVTRYVAASHLVRERIHEYWGRDSVVINPPVDTERFTPADHEDYFLVVSELVPHKRVDVALEAAVATGNRVKVVGEGPDLGRLRTRFGSPVEFLGRISDSDLDDLYPRSLAVVVPGVEEFGIVAVEAQAAGRPVLSVDVGGATETVIDGRTGVLVKPGSVPEMAAAMSEVDFSAFDVDEIRRNASRFSTARFVDRFTAEVAAA